MIKKNYFAKTYFYNLLELKLFSRGRQNYIIFIFERKKNDFNPGSLALEIDHIFSKNFDF